MSYHEAERGLNTDILSLVRGLDSKDRITGLRRGCAQSETLSRKEGMREALKKTDFVIMPGHM